MNPRLLPASRLARSVLHMQSDEHLTELARRGSQDAFETLVTRHRRPLLRHCARVVGHADAEEAVQDAFLSAHAAVAGGAPVLNVRAWLHVVAHNAPLSILRARASHPQTSHDDCEPAECEDTSVVRREELRELVAAVQSLPLRQRDAIVMRELEGRSYEDIAAHLGASNGAVRQLLHRARQAVRTRLGPLVGFEPLLRWAAGGNGATAARVGALSGGCALTVKVCATALVPVVVGGIGAAPIVPGPSGRHVTAAHSQSHTGPAGAGRGPLRSSPAAQRRLAPAPLNRPIRVAMSHAVPAGKGPAAKPATPAKPAIRRSATVLPHAAATLHSSFSAPPVPPPVRAPVPALANPPLPSAPLVLRRNVDERGAGRSENARRGAGGVRKAAAPD